MNVNQEKIKAMRVERGWTQQHLADVSNLSLRTVQRIESLGVASMETVNALCSVFEIERKQLLGENLSDSIKKAADRPPTRLIVSHIFAFTVGVVLTAISFMLSG